MPERVQVREIHDDEGARLLRIRRAQMVPLSVQRMPVTKIAYRANVP
jgi:hypothetical protein